MAVKLTKKAFREWLLEQQAKGYNVGRAGSYTSCPIAIYYGDTNPKLQSVGVSDDNVSYTSNGRDYYKTMPRWGNRFVAMIDEFSGDVPANLALEVLDNA